MTGSLEIKITISEFVTPALFQALAAVSNPRQRAALIKRLAEDALRASVTPAQTAPPVGFVSQRASDAISAGPEPAAVSGSSPAIAQRPLSQSAAPNEEQGQFDYAFLADKLGDFG